jgi:hypothetical protein
MEIGDNCVFTQHLEGVGEVKISFIEVGPSRGLMATIIEHCGECRDWRSTDKINESIGTSCFILDVEVEVLKICGTIMMVVIMKFSFCLHEIQ